MEQQSGKRSSATARKTLFEFLLVSILEDKAIFKSLKTEIQISGNQENNSDKLFKNSQQEERNKKGNVREKTTRHIGKGRIAKASSECVFISEKLTTEGGIHETFFLQRNRRIISRRSMSELTDMEINGINGRENHQFFRRQPQLSEVSMR